MTQQENPQNQQSSEIQIRDIIALCLEKWHWFVISFIFFFGVTIFLLVRQTPTYTRSAAIMIKENSRGGGSSMFANQLGAAADMGLFSGNSNVQNELTAIASPAVILEVVKRLHLDMHYSVKEAMGLRNKVLYGRNLPIKVTLIDIEDNAPCSFKIDINGNNAHIYKIKYKTDNFSESYNTELGDTIETVLGKIVLTLNEECLPQAAEEIAGKTINISRSGLIATVMASQKKLTAQLNNKQNTIIDLTYVDASIQCAEEFINTLISVYNENWVKDKNQIAVSTSQFIDERLAIIEQELGNVDNDISKYKSENQIPDLQVVAQLAMDKANRANSVVMDLNNELYMARYIRSFMSTDANNNQLLPANSGISSASIESQISEYNTKLLQRNSLVANSSERNPMVVDLDKQLGDIRSAIIISIDNQISALQTQIQSYQAEEQRSNAQITSTPSQAKYLLSVERQQKVKEALYLFLLQKREENELSQAFTAYNTRLVTPPVGLLTPTAPVKSKFLLVAFALALLAPIGLIYLLESMNTTVRGRKDIEKLPTPFVGEIPQADLRTEEEKKKFKMPSLRPSFSALRKKHKERKDVYKIVVKEKSRDAMNEAFRVVRTNLEFMIGSNANNKVIMITSANPSSGKTFLSANLAVSLAIKGCKVICLDLDLRRASLSHYVDNPKNGISNFLSNQTDNWKELVVKSPAHENFEILSVGKIPPNPTELLFNPKLEGLINDLKQEYDYIFIDCPPIEIVADASIIAKFGDMTIFVIRAKVFERELLPMVERYYNEKKFNNLAVLLNGTEMGGKYGSHRYGYRYGYHYGYGSYGYHK